MNLKNLKDSIPEDYPQAELEGFEGETWVMFGLASSDEFDDSDILEIKNIAGRNGGTGKISISRHKRDYFYYLMFPYYEQAKAFCEQLNTLGEKENWWDPQEIEGYRCVVCDKEDSEDFDESDSEL